MFELRQSLPPPSYDGVCTRVQFGIGGWVSHFSTRSIFRFLSELCLRIPGPLSALVRRSFSASPHGAFALPSARFGSRDLSSETPSQTAHERYSRFVVDAEVGGGALS